MSYKISVKAAEDIDKIWWYTVQKWSIEQADRYVNLIFDEIEYVSKNSTQGRDFSHIRKNYRCSKVKSHLIFYKITEEGIEVIRVLHQRMDVEGRLIE
ncbi:MAG: type II toxin-antitoxin system RelE/ParE family toxin [Cytophagales bacterium]|nr:type II toxin-antitoxin system RelE/ParE family toxin [Cytophagales bacterium]